MTRGSLLVGLLLTAAMTGAVSAQPEEAGDTKPEAPAQDPKQAKKWQQAGATLVGKGDALARRKPDEAKTQYENAVTAYEKAIEFGADANVVYELAVVLDKLGKYADAYKRLRLVVKDGSGARPDVLKKATTKSDDLATKIGLVTLVTKPDGATISIGGEEVGRSPMSEPLALMPGTYTIALSADGFQPKQAEIKVEAGSESERTMELEPVPVRVDPPTPPEQRTPPPPPPVADGPSMVPVYIGGGAAVALFGATTITGLMAKNRHDTFVAPASTADEREAARTSGKKLALVADVCLIGGVAAVGFTAYWYFAKYKSSKNKASDERKGDESAKLDVVPWVKPDAGGFSVAGSF